MSTVNQVNMSDAAKYLVDIPTSVMQPESIDFDTVYSEISSGDEDLDTIFEEVAEEYGVDVNLLRAVAQAESGFDVNAVSSCGAMGIMQLMPATANSLEVEDPYDARQNITGGAKMLAYLLDDYNGNVTLALAAYNAGSGAVHKYGGVPPYAETQNYIKKINDILGGALDNDSTTIEGAEPTQLYGVSQTSEEEVYYSAPVTFHYGTPAASRLQSRNSVSGNGYAAAADAYKAAYENAVCAVQGQDYAEVLEFIK